MRRTSVLSDEGVAGVHPRNQTINARGAELMGTLGRGWGRHVFLQEDGRQRGVSISVTKGLSVGTSLVLVELRK